MATYEIKVDYTVALITQFMAPQDMAIHPEKAKYKTLVSGFHGSTMLFVAAAVMVFFSSYWAVILGALGYLLRSITLGELEGNEYLQLYSKPQQDWLEIFGYVVWKWSVPTDGQAVVARGQEPGLIEWVRGLIPGGFA
jgi:hypothetical protein